MTPQQQATLGEIAMWIGTTQQLLRQAQSAACTNTMRQVVPLTARTAIADALGDINNAAQELLPLVQEVERE